MTVRLIGRELPVFRFGHDELRDVEHAGILLNLQAGEDVRWLPRRNASDIPLLGNDFWLLDERLVQFHHFTGTGDWASDGKERTCDAAVVALCATAFATVWERGNPHEKYTGR